MKDLHIEKSALVGVLFGNTVVYNIVEREGEFQYTGMSIVNFLKNDRNKFLSLIMESQSYDGIKTIFDDKFIFGDFSDTSDGNVTTFNDVYSFIYDTTGFGYFYIYDILNDALIVKTPKLPVPIGLDYHNSADVRSFLLYK